MLSFIDTFSSPRIKTVPQGNLREHLGQAGSEIEHKAMTFL